LRCVVDWITHWRSGRVGVALALLRQRRRLHAEAVAGRSGRARDVLLDQPVRRSVDVEVDPEVEEVLVDGRGDVRQERRAVLLSLSQRPHALVERRGSE
jgi:hypothetical protein